MRFPRSQILSAALSFVLIAPVVVAQSSSEALSLNDAIRQALDKNFTIKAQASGTMASRADLSAEWGDFHPRFSGSYTHGEDGSPQSADPFTGNRPPSSIVETDTYNLGIGGISPWGMSYRLTAYSQNQRGTFNGFADNYFTFSGLEASQPLLRGFGYDANMVGVRIARATHGSSRWQYRQTVMDVVTSVINGFLELDFAHKNLDIARRSRDLAQGLLDENEKRFEAGSLSQADVTSARTRVATREEAILISERAVSIAENFLKGLISDEKTAALLSQNLVIAKAPALPDHHPDPAVEFMAALERRPDYQQAKLNVARTDANRRYRRNQLLPQVDLVGSVGYNGLDNHVSKSQLQVIDRDSRSYSVGVVFSTPLTFAAERGRYRSAKFSQEQAEMQLAQTEQNIVVMLGNAAGQIETTRQRVEVSRHSLGLAEQALDAELKKLRAGSGSTFFVLAQQEILAGAEISAYRAEIDHQRALAEYDRQLGITLEKHGIAIEGDTETKY
ncbi:TolC family protein [Synoicihabitans lomoniglobus]|uniref:TolC family protein n=1 Tax=Synoicihabitans lomoniglobus TaxID=2909285 RepID=A0AAF0CRF1_9BACT|nr:TolC family protein [Opitutaceae bacterium LMO-M01]WED66591.1 TolC family protein [Opitutaceae bacterium LMO-M01]